MSITIPKPVNTGGLLRPVLYRLSFAEMVVPYGDPAYPHYKKVSQIAGLPACLSVYPSIGCIDPAIEIRPSIRATRTSTSTH